MTRPLGTFAITVAFFCLLILGVAYPVVGMAICAVIAFAFFWFMFEFLFGHHFDSGRSG